jgi:hypothetical protein
MENFRNLLHCLDPKGKNTKQLKFMCELYIASLFLLLSIFVGLSLSFKDKFLVFCLLFALPISYIIGFILGTYGKVIRELKF